jgi:hypothetical protein
VTWDHPLSHLVLPSSIVDGRSAFSSKLEPMYFVVPLVGEEYQLWWCGGGTVGCALQDYHVWPVFGYINFGLLFISTIFD